jgi:hypothetical protein
VNRNFEGTTSKGARNRLFLGAALSALLVTAGCSHKEAAGHVNGTLKGVSIGSLVGTPPQPLSGEIVLTDDTGKATKVTAGADGSYSVALPGGNYKASVSSVNFSLPASSCHTQLDSYTVLPGGTSTIDFVCRP